MKNKRIRQQAIKEILSSAKVSSQEDLLRRLTASGFSLTQATLSRDLKLMKVVKQPTEVGDYIYILPQENASEIKLLTNKKSRSFADIGFKSISFSGNMAVIKTKPAYAGGIASDIDAKAYPQILGSIAGDDTIFLVIKEGISRELVLEVLSSTIPSIKG